MGGCDGNVVVLDAGGRSFDDDLLQVAVAGAHEGHGVIAGAGGGDSGQMRVEGENGFGDDRELAAEWRVDVEAAEVFADLSQLGVDAVQAGGDEVQAACARSGEATLNVLHEFSPEIRNFLFMDASYNFLKTTNKSYKLCDIKNKNNLLLLLSQKRFSAFSST